MLQNKKKGNLSRNQINVMLTARLKMRMFVVFLIFLLRMTTRTTRRLPTNPIMMTRVKMMGTTMGTTAIRISRCLGSTPISSPPEVVWFTDVSFILSFCQDLLSCPVRKWLIRSYRYLTLQKVKTGECTLTSQETSLLRPKYFEWQL